MIFKINNKLICYNATPKCGCTTTKAMLMEASTDQDLNISTDNYEFVHRKHNTRNFSIEKADFKFCIIRDPVERFVSGYSNRVIYHRNISFVEFDQFINNFNYFYKTFSTIQHHFNPQVTFIGTNPDYYDQIFWLNELDSLGEVLSSFAGKTIKPKRLQTGGSDKKPTVNNKQKEFIKKFYKKDYDFLKLIKNT